MPAQYRYHRGPDSDLLARELDALRDLRDHAGLIESYSPGRPGAALLFEAVDAAEVERNLATLPMRHAGLITTEVIPLHRLDRGTGDQR